MLLATPRLWGRPSYDGNGFTYYLLYTNENGHRRQKSLGHHDKKKAEKQRVAFEVKLRDGATETESVPLSDFWDDWKKSTGGQIRESTRIKYETAMTQLIETVGDIDFKKVRHRLGEQFLQICRDDGNTPATVAKKIRELKSIFQLAVQ